MARHPRPWRVVRLALEAGRIAYTEPPRDREDALAGDLARDRPQPPFAPPYLKADDLILGQTANILLFLGEKHGLAPASLQRRLWVNQLQLTIADCLRQAGCWMSSSASARSSQWPHTWRARAGFRLGMASSAITPNSTHHNRPHERTRMMGQRQIHVDREDRRGGIVATVTIDNAARLNSLNTGLMEEFCDALAALAAEDRTRACVITGRGDRAFIGGADIKEMSRIASPPEARAFITLVHRCCHAVRAIPAPTIARINGFCFGAGLELAASCDLRIAAETARFGMPEVKLGIPSVVEAALLPSLVGWGRTRQMLLLGETFDAVTAQDWGLLERVVSPAGLDDAVEQWIGKLVSAQPRAVRLQKRLIGAWEDLPIRAAVQAGIDAFAAAFETDEPATAMSAFLAAEARRKAAR